VDSAVQSGAIILSVSALPKSERQADLAQVEAVARVVARNLNGYNSSWKEHGSGDNRAMAEANHSGYNLESRRWRRASPSPAIFPASPDFDVASNPEFLREGKALEDFFRPDRIVCGVESERRGDFDQPLQPLQRRSWSPTSARGIDQARANAFLSTKISFINMVADLCEKVGADVTAVTKHWLDSRIGPSFLTPESATAGTAFQRCPRFHLSGGRAWVDFSLLQEVERVNQRG